jgi:hypothetical protein
MPCPFTSFSPLGYGNARQPCKTCPQFSGLSIVGYNVGKCCGVPYGTPTSGPVCKVGTSVTANMAVAPSGGATASCTGTYTIGCQPCTLTKAVVTTPGGLTLGSGGSLGISASTVNATFSVHVACYYTNLSIPVVASGVVVGQYVPAPLGTNGTAYIQTSSTMSVPASITYGDITVSATLNSCP